MTLVRNGEDYLEPCISVVAPHVKAVQIILDSRSDDSTLDVVKRLAEKFSNVEWTVFPVTDPLKHLVEIRNQFLPFEEEWGFIVDSDEYHQDIAQYSFGDECKACAFQNWSVWNERQAHRSSSRAVVGRVFRNSPGLVWRGAWGKEVLYDYGEPIFREAEILPHRYIHFTHLKKDNWREEMKQKRVADGKFLSPMPSEIINKVKEIHETYVPDMRFR